MTDIIFEHPLTEKMRTWLRLEHLLKAIKDTQDISSEAIAIAHLRALIEISEVLERGDIKVDLYKDVDRLLARFSLWAQADEVDHQLIVSWQQKLTHLASVIKQSGRFNTHLQGDKLLNVLRQRLSIPGGCCNFDLPTLHVWLNLPKNTQMLMINDWFQPLDILYQTLATIMSLTRDMGILKEASAKKGFYQDVSENKELLRVHIKSNALIYPQISGVKNRFMIRFLPYDADTGIVPDEFDFSLTSC